MLKIKIAPSILSCDFLRMGEEIQKVIDGGSDLIHVDVMDGHFVPNLSIGVPVIKALKKKFSTPLDVHLMISNPDSFMDPFLEAGSDILTFHIEASQNPQGLIEKIKGAGKQVGVALKPGTPVEAVKGFLKSVDMVLVMTVEPGFSGQKFMGDMIPKIRQLRQEWGFLGDIQVDGGIGPENAHLCTDAGANVLVAASAIFGKADPAQAVRELRENCGGG